MKTRWITLLAIAGFTILTTWFTVAGDLPAMSLAQAKRVSAAVTPEPARLPGGTIGDIAANETCTLYLPLVVKEPPPPPPPPSISGTMTYNGNPIAGIALTLQFTQDGTTFTTFSNTVTLANGEYRFTNLPNIQQSGQRYFVRYVNQTDNRYLSAWYTRSITENFTGEVNIGNFDIANVLMNAPAHPHTGPLPVTFRWTARGIASDRYFVQLFGPPNYVPRFLSEPILGNTYTLNTLPSGFQMGVQYGWNVGIKSPDEDGGTGYSFYYRSIIFTSSAFHPAHPRLLAQVLYISPPQQR